MLSPRTSNQRRPIAHPHRTRASPNRLAARRIGRPLRGRCRANRCLRTGLCSRPIGLPPRPIGLPPRPQAMTRTPKHVAARPRTLPVCSPSSSTIPSMRFWRRAPYPKGMTRRGYPYMAPMVGRMLVRPRHSGRANPPAPLPPPVQQSLKVLTSLKVLAARPLPPANPSPNPLTVLSPEPRMGRPRKPRRANHLPHGPRQRVKQVERTREHHLACLPSLHTPLRKLPKNRSTRSRCRRHRVPRISEPPPRQDRAARLVPAPKPVERPGRLPPQMKSVELRAPVSFESPRR